MGALQNRDRYPDVEGFGGYGGRTLARQMRDKTDELYDEWMAYTGEDAEILQGRIEGACEMLAILCSTNSDLQWDSTEARYEDRQRRKDKPHNPIDDA